MKISELEIDWKSQTQDFQRWVVGHAESIVKPLSPGVEADIFAVGHEKSPSYVFKRWKKDFAQKQKEQFDFLNVAVQANLPVTQPVGWGVDASNRGILATKYGGEPVQNPSKEQLDIFTSTLSAIHNISFKGFKLQEPKDNQAFISKLLDRKFLRLDSQPDIYPISEKLRESIPLGQFSLIHGDYHIGNILLKGSRLSVIDWTDAQIGDYRYDLAWSSFLLWIYGDEQSQTVFLDSYLKARETKIDRSEYIFFELIAAIIWILIRRQFPVGGELEKAYHFVNSRLLDKGFNKGLLLR